jgi:hypothetical protein
MDWGVLRSQALVGTLSAFVIRDPLLQDGLPETNKSPHLDLLQALELPFPPQRGLADPKDGADFSGSVKDFAETSGIDC